MTMALSSSILADCPQNHVGSVGKSHSSVTETYEIFEEFLESAALRCGVNQMTMVMSPDYSSDADLERSNGDKSNVGEVLQNNIKSWSEATGLPTTITVHFKDRSFHLHKFPLISRSGYLKRVLGDAKEIIIPDACPGDPEIFEIVANFCYGSTVQMEPYNVADLRCASEYLQMSEEFSKSNLCERSDIYLNQVALQSWHDTMVVLLHCQNLYPYAEDLGIVSRCVECLAFLACVEMVDPLEKTSRPGMSIESKFWGDISVSTKGTKDSSSPDWWMDDLLRLPCGLFERVIAAIRREGMQEKYVSQAIVKFVDRWVFTSSCPETDDVIRFNQNDSEFPPKSSHESLVQAVVRLLPEERDAVPISFLFSLLRCALACNSSADCKSQLELRIASQLELATISDFLYPFKITEEGCISAAEVSCMRRIVNSFMSQQRSLSDPSEALPAISNHEIPENFYCAYAVSAVAKVWDEYLAEVARDLTLTPLKFSELAEVVPSYARATHDHLYRAIHVYLKVHPHFSQEERQMVCGILNCQKLSPEMCTHAVQNELMPLRMIVQAMFMQQLQTRNALSGHLQYNGQSTRLESLAQPPLATTGASCRRNSLSFHIRTESFRSSRESFRIRSRHNSFGSESFGGEDEIEDDSASLGYIVKREAAFRQAALLKADFDATETRLQNLEEELAFMKKKIDGGTPPVGKCTSERFSVGGSRRKRKEGLMPVPEGVAASDVEDDDAEAAGEVKFSARTGNGMGFITRVLRLITLGGYRRRKAADIDAAALDSACSEHIFCGGRGMWRNYSSTKIKRGKRMAGLDDLVVKNTSTCVSQNIVKNRHSRRHSIS